MDTLTAIHSRFSVPMVSPDAVPRGVIEMLLSAAVQAPALQSSAASSAPHAPSTSASRTAATPKSSWAIVRAGTRAIGVTRSRTPLRASVTRGARSWRSPIGRA